MVGIDPETILEPYQVLTTTIEGKTSYSIIKFDEERIGNRRKRWLTFIPNAGNEANAARVVRLLNGEALENIRRHLSRVASDEKTDIKETE